MGLRAWSDIVASGRDTSSYVWCYRQSFAMKNKRQTTIKCERTVDSIGSRRRSLAIRGDLNPRINEERLTASIGNLRSHSRRVVFPNGVELVELL